MQNQQLLNIPKDKFKFVNNENFGHDQKLDTKPVGYFRDAFNRFKKNKGSVVAAWVILVLVLYAVIAPIFSQYSVSYNDTYYRFTLPKCEWFADTNFWDGCEEKELNKARFTYFYAMGQETGHNSIKNQEYTKTSDGMYKFRLDSYHSTGMIYKSVTVAEYQSIQQYQLETNRQVIYPTVDTVDRPQATQDKNDANYYFKTDGKYKTTIIYDNNGNVIPVYKAYTGTDTYNSLRIEGETPMYDYARYTDSGWEIRINYYEYYKYYHSHVLKDNVKEPSFLFGTTETGQDIFTCLASGARFSFLFAIAVCVVNFLVGAIYGMIEGYYGGAADLIMERVSDILGAIPFMIVITLLKLHMKGASQMLILFISFFATGWIGTAGSVRMQFYRFKNQEYVLAARTLGAKDRRIMLKHIFPNALGTLVTGSVLAIPSMIYSETNLSYLGIINLTSGDLTSVGTLLAAGQPFLMTFPHIILFPSVFLALLMLSFNLFGNGLRDAFNPSLRGSED